MANIKQIEGVSVKRILSAKFYLFKYITDKPNIYYNIYPLVFTLGKLNSDLFQGIDFHYIPPKQRMFLLNELYQITPSLTTSPLRFSSIFKKLMVTVKKFRPALVAFKRYNISSIVGGKIIRIDPESWESVILEPIEKFVSGTKQVSAKRVWKESLRLQRI